MSEAKKIISAVLSVFLLIVFCMPLSLASIADNSTHVEDGIAPEDLIRGYTSDDDIIADSDIVKVVSVKVDGFDLVTGRPTREIFERGETIDLKIKLETAAKVEDGEIIAWISGDEHSNVVEVSEPFTLRPDTENSETIRKTIELQITIPTKADIDDGDYKLHILVSAKDNTVAVYNFPLRIEAQQNSVRIRDVIVSPSQQIMANRGFSVIARVENLGECDEEGVKVTASVPALGLGVMNSDHIDTLDAEDSASSPDIYLRVPQNAKPGVYDLMVEVEYDDGDKKVTAVLPIEVVNPEYVSQEQQESERAEKSQPKKSEGKTVVQVGPEMQEVIKGQGGAIYPLTLTNEGSEAKTYIIGVSGAEPFATTQISPSNVVIVDPSESESVYVYVSAREDAQVGTHTFTVDIKSADKVLQQIPLMANVVEDAETAKSGKTDDLKKGLEIALIVLIVVLVILGLIIAFTKARKSNEEEPIAGQTYY